MNDGGKLKLYTLENTGVDGMMPVEQLVEYGGFFFSKRTVGYNRMYAAMGANTQVDVLVRVFGVLFLPETVKYAILDIDGSSIQYRIDGRQAIVEKDAYDLSLVRLEEFYDIAKK